MSQHPAYLPIALSDVRFERAGRCLLGPINLRLRGGARTLIMGPNGAGKSLLLRLCHGLLAPTTGHVQCGSAGSPEQKAVRQRQAMVFQRPVMLRRSVLANVIYAFNVRAEQVGNARDQALKALAMVGLETLATRSARVLSGGEQQRLALARAWVRQPEVLFLDEPTSALDPSATQAIEAAIGRFADNGTTVVMSTHNLGQARRLADHCVFLANGELIEHSPATAFFSSPATTAAAQFLAGEH